MGKQMISACLITYNERDMIKQCLDWLHSQEHIGEICIVDSYSTDSTWEQIKNYKSPKRYNVIRNEFKNFGDQKNNVLSMATGDWILLIDADETYSWRIHNLFHDLNNDRYPTINAIRIPTLVTYPDRKHCIYPADYDPHIRIWRRNFAWYRGECHERLFDKKDRDLHECNDLDILHVTRQADHVHVTLLHHQRLKRRDSLIEKGERWAAKDMLIKSALQGHMVHKNSWVEAQERCQRGEEKIIPIPKDYWDYKQ